MSASPIVTRPESLLSDPDRMFTTVVLPAPFGPINAVIDPFGTLNVAPLTALAPPKDLWMSTHASAESTLIAVGAPLTSGAVTVSPPS